MEPRGPGKPASQRRARSWDRAQKPRKDPASPEGQYLSLPATPPRPPAGRARPGSQHPEGPGSTEAPGAEALTPEAAREALLCEQRPPRDRKDRGRGQQGWLKAVLSFFQRPSPEEAKAKAAPRRKADRRARRKHSHGKHGDGDSPGGPGPEAGGREAAAAWRPQEAHRGPGPGGEQTCRFCGRPLPTQGWAP